MQRPQPKIFPCEKKNRVGFPPFTFHQEKQKVMASFLGTSWFADTVSVEKFIEGKENEGTRQKTDQNIALLKKFLTLKRESKAVVI